ncbi:hypothetical protein FQR65_LT07970 [Abscondita terminalis]|nr:hypothetical protein FQR65_LT07970 [Abscondita terminalis]
MTNYRIRRQLSQNIFIRKLTGMVCFLGKTTYTAGGLHMVIKGKQASRSEAPILVIAPHSTFFDGGIIYVTGFPSIIVRRESGANPYIGKLINFTQPVYVWRDDPDSRHNTIKEIINRATSDLDWPQILIFPEGTCTNRSCLITFKPGAFYPGVPIQPVCIRYPNKLDTVTWTWEGPSALKLLWLTLTQVYSYCEIEFLPVYTPSEAEKRDPKLFANNVRNVMAKALGIPVLDYTYDDCRLMTRAKEMNLPNATALVEVQKLRHRLGLDQSNAEEKLIEAPLSKNYRVALAQFAEYLNVPIKDSLVSQLFKCYDTVRVLQSILKTVVNFYLLQNSSGVIDFREYLLGVLATSKNRNILDSIKIACKVRVSSLLCERRILFSLFQIYDSSGLGRLSPEDFAKILNHTLAMRVDEAIEVFQQIDKTCLNYVTFEKFKSYAEKKAEFASLFSLSKEEKFKSKNGDICPDYDKKTE